MWVALAQAVPAAAAGRAKNIAVEPIAKDRTRPARALSARYRRTVPEFT
jgi:hypothetical protein